MFNTPYNYQKHSKPEINSGKSMVEKAGYVPAQKRIEDMILAGQRLTEYRKNQFDFEDKIDEDFTDPTRKANFDMADAFQAEQHAINSLKARSIAKKASQASQEPPESPKANNPE